MDLFSLVAKLTLDSNEFEKDLDRAEDKLKDVDVAETKLELDNDDFNGALEESQGLGDQFGTEMTGVFNGIKTALTVTGIVGLISGIVNGLKEAINMTAETADGIDKGSKKLGISRKAYQEWDHALRQSGSSIQDVKKGIINFQAAIKAADPKTMFADADDAVDGLADKTAGLSQDAYEAMRDLGLLDRLQAGEFQNAEQLMEASLLALAKYDGSTDDRGILVRKLFGRGGDALNALLDEGEAGVKSLLEEADKYGLIMTDEEIDNAVAYGDAMSNLQAEIKAIQQAFVADIIPVLTDAVKWLTDLLAFFNPRNKQSPLDDTFNDIDKRTAEAVRNIDNVQLSAQHLIDKLASMGDYWTLDEKGQRTWNELAKEFIETYPDFAHYIDLENHAINGNTKEIKENIRQWAIRERQRLVDENFAEKREAIAKKYADATKKEIDAEDKAIDALTLYQQAAERLNKLLSEHGGIRERFKEQFGTEYVDVNNLTNEQWKSIYEWMENDKGRWSAEVRRKTTPIKGMTERGEVLENEASNLRKQAKEMEADAEKAERNFARYQEAYEKKWKLTGIEADEATEKIETETEKVSELSEKIDNLPDDVYTTIHAILDTADLDHLVDMTGASSGGASFAIGSRYIPYDQMAMLHRGERVLTATENRRGEGQGIDYGHLEDRIATAIRTGMNGATVRSYLNGREITEEVNRENMRGVKGRRFAT